MADIRYPDRSYYRLPDGWTWAIVAEHRAQWEIDARYALIASVTGVAAAWGIPLASNYSVAP